jgi:hypothetical protein
MSYEQKLPPQFVDPNGMSSHGQEAPKKLYWLDEVVVIGERMFPKEFSYLYSINNNRTKQSTDVYVLMDRDLVKKYYLKQELRLINDFLQSLPVFDVVSAYRNSKNWNSDGITSIVDAVLKHLQSKGIAVTPMIKLLVMSSVCSFLSSNNPVGPEVPAFNIFGKEVDSLFYDTERSNTILEVIHKSKNYIQKFVY